ncbi:hypothetical protein K438DRAFT_1934756 [Mycena galopus ATCC 62051]|nr:hypothetical protein K438DRAFT_1934756 [Mycena galopus ATCC 62051]
MTPSEQLARRKDITGKGGKTMQMTWSKNHSVQSGGSSAKRKESNKQRGRERKNGIGEHRSSSACSTQRGQQNQKKICLTQRTKQIKCTISERGEGAMHCNIDARLTAELGMAGEDKGRGRERPLLDNGPSQYPPRPCPGFESGVTSLKVEKRSNWIQNDRMQFEVDPRGQNKRDDGRKTRPWWWKGKARHVTTRGSLWRVSKSVEFDRSSSVGESGRIYGPFLRYTPYIRLRPIFGINYVLGRGKLPVILGANK